MIKWDRHFRSRQPEPAENGDDRSARRVSAETDEAPFILVSRPIAASLIPELGKAHYSYGFAAAAFVTALERAGLATQPIASPEQFKSRTYALANDLTAERYLHLIFRSAEDIRPIAGAFNVACFAWEFEALKSDVLASDSILSDQVARLRSCDEIWVPCTYTQSVLKRHGLTNTHVIPAPVVVPDATPTDRTERHRQLREIALFESVPLVSTSAADEEQFGRLAATYTLPLGLQPQVQKASNGGTIFLTVCNPYDQRKNLASLIDGFLMATEGCDDAVLIVKLVTSGMFGSPQGYLFHQIRVLFGVPHCLNENRVVLFSAYLEDDEMASLYASADYYLCASLAEGQNLPLLEAMAHGCVPVSVANTAMADYITTGNAVVMAEGRYCGAVSGTAGDGAGRPLSMALADRFQVAASVRAALALTDEERDGKRAAAKATVDRLFGSARVVELIRQRIAAMKEVAGTVPQS